MKRTIRATIDIVVEDMSKDDRADAAVLEGTVPAELPKLKDATLGDLGEVIETAIQDNPEAFGGSMIYARFSSAKVVHSQWKL